MNDGSIGTVTVGKWTAIREFNAAEEGIYVYGANVVPVEGKYQVLHVLWKIWIAACMR